MSSITPPTGTFVFASFGGFAFAVLGALCFGYPVWLRGANLISAVGVAFAFTSFAGGFFSGWILEPGLREHSWRLMWLAAGSPALPVWICALIAVFCVEDFPALAMVAVGLFCVSAVAGALAGCHVGHRYRIRRM